MEQAQIKHEYLKLFDTLFENNSSIKEIFEIPSTIKISVGDLLIEEYEMHYGALSPTTQIFLVKIINPTETDYFVDDVEIVEFDKNENDIEILDIKNKELKKGSVTSLCIIIDLTGFKEIFYSFSFFIKINDSLPLKQKIYFSINEMGKVLTNNSIYKTTTIDLEIKKKNNEYICLNEKVEVFCDEQDYENRVFIKSEIANYVRMISKSGITKIMDMPNVNIFSATIDENSDCLYFIDNREKHLKQYLGNIFVIDNNFNVYNSWELNKKNREFVITIKDNLKLLFPNFIKIIEKYKLDRRLHYKLLLNISEYNNWDKKDSFISVIDKKENVILEIPLKFNILYKNLNVEKINNEIELDQEQLLLPKFETNIKIKTYGIGKAQVEIPSEYINHQSYIYSNKASNLINYKLEIDTELFIANKERKIIVPLYFVNEAQKLTSYELIFIRKSIYCQNMVGSILGKYNLYYPISKKICDTILFEEDDIKIIDFDLKKVDIKSNNKIIFSKQENILTVYDEKTDGMLSKIKYLGNNRFEYYIYSLFVHKSDIYDYSMVFELTTNKNDKTLLSFQFIYNIFYFQKDHVLISYEKTNDKFGSKVSIVQNKNNKIPLVIYELEELENVKLSINKKNFKGLPVLINPASSLRIVCTKTFTNKKGIFNLKINSKDKIKIEI